MASTGQVMPNYRIVTVEKPPFVMYDPEKHEWSGYCIDLLTYLSGMLEFSYDIEFTPDGKYGSLHYDGTRDGMIRELQEKRADIALGALSIMSERMTVVDFTMPFYEPVGFSILLKKEKVKRTFFLFTKVFGFNLWLFMLGLYGATSICLWLYDRWSPFSWRNNPNKMDGINKYKHVLSLSESLGFTFLSATPQGCGESPRNPSSRLALLIWWSYTFLFLACYTAFLATSLTLSRLKIPLETFDDLIFQSRYNFFVIPSSEAHTYLMRRSHIETRLQEAWERLSLNMSLSAVEDSNYAVWENPIDDKYRKLIRRINLRPGDMKTALKLVNSEGQPFIGNAADIKYILSTHCEFRMIGPEFSKRPYGIAVQKDSPLRDQLDKAILQLAKLGILGKLKDLWWNEKINRPQCPREYKISDGMTIDDMGGIFVIIAVGICLAIVTLSIEFWWYRCWLPRKCCRRNRNKSEKNVKKLRFVVKPWKKGSRNVSKVKREMSM